MNVKTTNTYRDMYSRQHNSPTKIDILNAGIAYETYITNKVVTNQFLKCRVVINMYNKL